MVESAIVRNFMFKTKTVFLFILNKKIRIL